MGEFINEGAGGEGRINDNLLPYQQQEKSLLSLNLILGRLSYEAHPSFSKMPGHFVMYPVGKKKNRVVHWEVVMI